MAKNISKNVGWLAGWLAVLALVEGCAEAPRTVDDTETDQVGETKDARRDDASAEQEAEVDEQESGRIEEDGNACTANPCQHGGSCSSDAGQDGCVCTDGYIGQTCELKLCGSITIRSRDEVEQNRECGEVRGDLIISSAGLTAITADDFPFLTKITGDLRIAGDQVTNPPQLETVTLAKLRAVDGGVVVLGAVVIEFGDRGPLKELHLPALERIGARGPLGLLVYQTNLRVLDLPALETIEGGVALGTLFDLCTVAFDSVEHIGGELVIHDVPGLSARQFEPLRAAAAGEMSEALLGCCAPSADDRVSCESFTQSARVLYCTGC